MTYLQQSFTVAMRLLIVDSLKVLDLAISLMNAEEVWFRNFPERMNYVE